MTNPISPWWMPDRHQDRRPFLLARNRIKSAIRDWFNAQGFVEVETGCLQVSPGNEAHLHAFKTERIGTDLQRDPLYLHTSPEFACKKLMAAGEEKIFTFAPVFRNREAGPLHASEFTMLEWYRADRYAEVGAYWHLVQDCQALLDIAAEVTGRHTWTWRDRTSDIRRRIQTVTVNEAFDELIDLTLVELAFKDGKPNTERFHKEARDIGVSTSNDDSWADIFSRVLTEKIEPRLGTPLPQVLAEYPAHLSALARPLEHDPRLAERFELYVCGVELANGFGELNDARAQRQNLEAEMDLKQQRYGERYPIDEDFLDAVDLMQPCSGCALGFDRLVMLATGATHIDQVQWTPGPSRK